MTILSMLPVVPRSYTSVFVNALRTVCMCLKIDVLCCCGDHVLNCVFA